jgi:MoxR-like ATPase
MNGVYIMSYEEQFKTAILKEYGNGFFTAKQANAMSAELGFSKSGTKEKIYAKCLQPNTISRGKYAFAENHSFDVKVEKPSKEAVKKEVKKTVKKDWDIINSPIETEKVVLVNEFDNSSNSAPRTPSDWANEEKETTTMDLRVKTATNTVMNLIPKKDPQYVAWGHFKDIKTILESKVFYPIFVTGLSGNGKTSMIREVCAKLKRDMVRVNITVETDEDDLLGGFRLVNGETVWQDGPLVVAMKTGAIALIDEVDLASHKIMCLQPIMEGQPIYLKKINEVVYPAAGFNIVATANTKGKGSSDGRFMGTNILNEAFLDRFSATFYQEYPSTSFEEKILKKQFAKYEISEDDFVSKLVKWADVIRRSFKEGAVDDIVTTRRLIDITKTFSIFGNKMKAITLCLERFDDETRDSFADLYTKVDAGASFEDITNEVPAEDDIETENDTF